MQQLRFFLWAKPAGVVAPEQVTNVSRQIQHKTHGTTATNEQQQGTYCQILTNTVIAHGDEQGHGDDDGGEDFEGFDHDV